MLHSTIYPIFSLFYQIRDAKRLSISKEFINTKIIGAEISENYLAVKCFKPHPRFIKFSLRFSKQEKRRFDYSI